MEVKIQEKLDNLYITKECILNSQDGIWALERLSKIIDGGIGVLVNNGCYKIVDSPVSYLSGINGKQVIKKIFYDSGEWDTTLAWAIKNYIIKKIKEYNNGA